jgi:hypothetical protein
LEHHDSAFGHHGAGVDHGKGYRSTMARERDSARRERRERKEHDVLEAYVTSATKQEMARGAVEALKVGRRNSVAQAAEYLMSLRGGAGSGAAAGNLAARAARRIQRCARKWLARLRLLDVRLKIFALDIRNKAPLEWDRPERVRSSHAAEAPPPEPEPESEPDSDEEKPPPKPKPKRKKKKEKKPDYFPQLRPMPRRRRSRFDPTENDPLPWAVPVDTSNDAVRSKPLPKKNLLLLTKSVRKIPRRKPPKDKIEELERECRASNEMLRDTLEQHLYDEQYRSVIDVGKNSNAITRSNNRVARHLGRVSYERVKFDCQAAMVIQLRDSGFLR